MRPFYLLAALHGTAAFVRPPTQLTSPTQQLRAILDDDDLSPLDTLLRCGFMPFSVRMSNPAAYEADVDKLMAGEWMDGLGKCDRLVAQP